MKINSKAQGLSLNTIIIAALVLIVLVVLVVIFTGKIRDWSSDTNTCESLGGSCKVGTCDTGWANRGQQNCGTGSVCCIEVMSENPGS